MFTFSHSAADMSGGASEMKFKENIPMAECVAYGNHSVSGSFPGGVMKGRQRMENGNDADEIYERIPN